MQGDNLHEMSKLILWGKIRKVIHRIVCWNVYPAGRLVADNFLKRHILKNIRLDISYESFDQTVKYQASFSRRNKIRMSSAVFVTGIISCVFQGLMGL